MLLTLAQNHGLCSQSAPLHCSESQAGAGLKVASWGCCGWAQIWSAESQVCTPAPPPHTTDCSMTLGKSPDSSAHLRAHVRFGSSMPSLVQPSAEHNGAHILFLKGFLLSHPEGLH